jgi:hypothetical protein
MKIEIDPAFLTSVTIHNEWSMFKNKTKLTDDELVKILKGEDRCSSTSSDDHPEFKKVRNQLEKEGYINTWRSCWNGDRVTKAFTFNGAKFKKGEQFPCGAAMAGHLKFIKKVK